MGSKLRNKSGLKRISLLLTVIVFITWLGLHGCSDSSVAPDFQDYNDLPDAAEYEVITDQLEIPWQMAFLPDGRILITERNGLVRVVENDLLQHEPWLDLRDSIKTADGSIVTNSGVMGIAADPDFEANRFIYVGYSYDAPHTEEYDYNRLVRYYEDPQTNIPAVDKVLLEDVKGLSMHNSAQIKFGPDGMLYWSLGERHKEETAQDPETLPGSILRMTRNGEIPPDNPFSGSYIYAYGLRNTQGFDWHPDSCLMMATDHGPSGPQGCCHDEVNIIEPGKNYGWPVIRGGEEADGMVTPFLHSGVGDDRDKYTWAPSGAAFMHSGPWRGTFLFAGLRSQSLWQVVYEEDGGEPVLQEFNRYLNGVFGRIRSVDQSPNGDIYIITSNLDQHDVPFSRDYLVRITPN